MIWKNAGPGNRSECEGETANLTGKGTTWHESLRMAWSLGTLLPEKQLLLRTRQFPAPSHSSVSQAATPCMPEIHVWQLQMPASVEAQGQRGEGGSSREAGLWGCVVIHVELPQSGGLSQGPGAGEAQRTLAAPEIACWVVPEVPDKVTVLRRLTVFASREENGFGKTNRNTYCCMYLSTKLLYEIFLQL